MKNKRRVIITTENEPIDKPENTVWFTVEEIELFDKEKLMKNIRIAQRMIADEIIIRIDQHR